MTPRISLVPRSRTPIDVDLLQLIDQQHRRVAIHRPVTRCHLDREAVVRAVAELLHYLAGLFPAPGHVWVIARQFCHLVRRHTPQAAGWRLQHPADLPLSLAEGIDNRLTVDAQCHRSPQTRVAEWR